ncbi:hypothetical protein OS493_038782 [Desmophyllum pertusum]|uniref:Uncharacterized protein n=1 Tax=Desmophyllum pertusum TaxID=174260 RepID=A0A9W9YUA6_9CNID|nr:hypothetical protein OS493_038782 [Desmophyllum pertusum]
MTLTPLEISELTGHANPESISSYSHNPLDKQRRMSNTLAGFNATSTANSQNSSNSRPVLREVVVDSSATAATAANDTANNANNTAAIPDTGASRSGLMMAGAVGGMFTEVTFNNSPVNISINFQSNLHPANGSLQ